VGPELGLGVRAIADVDAGMEDWIRQYLAAQKRAVESIDVAAVNAAIDLINAAHRGDQQIFVCGNGGSASNASHFATDLGKCSSDAVGKGFRVLTLNDNTSWITAIGNDYAYEDVFVRQLQNYGRAGDVLIAVSVSGNSRPTALVGGPRGGAADLADQLLVIEDLHYGRVEDAQMHILHMLCYAFVENPAIARRG
jgi:D-sedoheptulose 7-phosphate isomerase